MNSAPALRLYKGRTTHVRFTPFERRFHYGIFMIDVDIDRLDEAAKSCALFSIERQNLFSFKRRDHGTRKNTELRPWAEQEFAKSNVSLDGGSIRLVTFPQGFFYKFAPISVWFGYGPDHKLRGVIYEVNNTFGETHCYVAPATQAKNQHQCDKNFHVSPFWDVTGQYRFTIHPLDRQLNVVIDSIVDGKRIHMANIKAKQLSASSWSLLKTAITKPFATIGVTIGIHWEAFWLWVRGAGYRSKPIAPEKRTTIATPILSDDTQDQAA